MTDVKTLLADPDFAKLSHADQDALLAKLGAIPNPADEGVVSDLPGGGFKSPPTPVDLSGGELEGTDPISRALQSLTSPEALPGMAKSAARTGVNLAEMATRSPTGKKAPIFEELLAALAPSNPDQAAAGEREHAMEFMTPTGPASASTLGAAARAAVEGGLIGSAQKGEPDVEAAVGGGLMGGAMHAGIGAAKSIGAKLLKRAPELLAQLAGARSGTKGNTMIKAAEEALDAGDVAGFHGEDALAGRAQARATKLQGPADAYKAEAAKTEVDLEPYIERLNKLAAEEVREGANGRRYINNQARYDHIKSVVAKLEAMVAEAPEGARGTPIDFQKSGLEQRFSELKASVPSEPTGRTTVPAINLEDKLQALVDEGKVYERSNPAKAPTKEATDTIRQQLNEEIPGRADVMRPYGRAIALAKGLEDMRTRSKLKPPSQAGEQFATRGAIGALLGGATHLGAPTGAGVAILATRFLNSPAVKALSAQTQYNLGRQLASLSQSNPDLVARALGGSLGSYSEILSKLGLEGGAD